MSKLKAQQKWPAAIQISYQLTTLALTRPPIVATTTALARITKKPATDRVANSCHRNNNSSTYDFLLAFHRNHVPILCYFRDIAREILVENLHYNIHTSPIFGVPFGTTSLEFRQDLWRQKTRVPGLSCSVACPMISLAILTEH